MGRDLDKQKIGQIRVVSIHAPTWGATCPFCGKPYNLSVSIHAPTWGATRKVPGQRPTPSRFNPRAHVGRDFPKQLSNDGEVVSIHAPTWGATEPYGRSGRCLLVSIHAPTWGATVQRCSSVLVCTFQSTRPRGARRLWVSWSIKIISVSIHAPTWGATSLHIRTNFAVCFNPRAHVGRDRWSCRCVLG